MSFRPASQVVNMEIPSTIIVQDVSSDEKLKEDYVQLRSGWLLVVKKDAIAFTPLDELGYLWLYWKDEFLRLLGEAGFTEVQVLTESPLYKEGHSFVFRATKRGVAE